jgi:hypothetical protein
MKRALAGILLLGWLAGACTDRQHRNPLDPESARPQSGLFEPLQALAGDGQVSLSWDYTHFRDVEGYRLFRRLADQQGQFAPLNAEPLPASTTQYVDEKVENGTTYEYRLSLLVQGEGERFIDEIRRATPGPELAWVADRGSGLVWKISADASSAHFARGRFRDLADLALDRRDGSCWISDRLAGGLYRIDAEGQVEPYAARVEQPGLLEIDAGAGRGWLIDERRREVSWFRVPVPGDTLELVGVDARFAAPVGLAAQDGGCWIADREQGRVLFYQPEGKRRIEFPNLERPGRVAAGSQGEAWALVLDGGGLVRLDQEGGFLEAELPFARARALDVDRQEGACWVLGEQEVAVLGANGRLMQRWTDLPGGRSLAVDEVNRRVWVGTEGTLRKLAHEGVVQARLEGFASIVGVAVDPGAP